MKRFEEIPHTADWSFRAFGRDLPELFENAAHALFVLQGITSVVISSEQSEREIPLNDEEISRSARNDNVKYSTQVVEVIGIDLESLFVNWLSELLYLQDSHRKVYVRFQIESLTPTSLRAEIFGLPLAHIDKLIKAVTYHNLKIEQTTDGWEAVVVVDV
jgi:SHS2 domain-containing protein